MANEGTTVVLGIPIPSTNPVFLAIIGVHVLFGLAAVITGGAAILSQKGRGRHSNFGTIYFWCLYDGSVSFRRDQFWYSMAPVCRSTLSRCTSELSRVTMSAMMLPSSALTSPVLSRLQAAPFKAAPEGEAFYQQVQDLQPTKELQRGLQTRIVQVTNDLMQARFLLFSHLGSSIPAPFLAVLLLWIIILFAGFSLMAPANATTLASLVICALSVSGAIFLILELDQPFAGMMMVPSEPLRNALLPLN
jgi:hypothetical protein